ncbi:MAG: hypothetical protein WCT01_02370 [Candidatus Shapirobacteria bacterium]
MINKNERLTLLQGQVIETAQAISAMEGLVTYMMVGGMRIGLRVDNGLQIISNAEVEWSGLTMVGGVSTSGHRRVQMGIYQGLEPISELTMVESAMFATREGKPTEQVEQTEEPEGLLRVTRTTTATTEYVLRGEKEVSYLGVLEGARVEWAAYEVFGPDEELLGKAETLVDDIRKLAQLPNLRQKPTQDNP